MNNSASPFAALTSDVTRVVLDNGLTILVKEVYGASVANLSVWVKVGSTNETDKIAGISHFVEHMLFKGTGRRKVGEIAREIHAVGGYMNAFTDYECTCYWVVVPSKFLDIALDVQADALMHSTFDPEEIRKECRVILEEMKMYQDRPESFCFDRLMELAFTHHYYRRPIIGFEASLLPLTRDDLLAYVQQYYKPGNVTVALVGNVSTKQALKKITATFSPLPPSPLERHLSPLEPSQEEYREKTFEGDTQRAHMELAFHCPAGLDEETYPLRIVATILGEGRSSRLCQELKERKRLVESIDAGVFAQGHPGFFIVDAVLDPEKTPQAREAIFQEIARLQDRPVGEEEILKAKHMAESSYIFSQETVEGQGRNLGFYEILGDYTMADRYVERLGAVTAQEVQEAARKFLRKENCSLAEYRPRNHGG